MTEVQVNDLASQNRTSGKLFIKVLRSKSLRSHMHVCIVCWIIRSVSSTLLNMNTKSFYAKNLTLVTTLEEVNDIVEASDHVLIGVVLPHEAGDNQSPDTDEENINDNLDDAFEPTGQLEVEEETDEESDHETTECRWLD